MQQLCRFDVSGAFPFHPLKLNLTKFSEFWRCLNVHSISVISYYITALNPINENIQRPGSSDNIWLSTFFKIEI